MFPNSENTFLMSYQEGDCADDFTERSDKSPVPGIKQIMTYQPVRFSPFQVLPPVLCTRRLYIQLICLLMVGLVVFLVRAMASMRLTFVQYHLESDTDGELVILPAEFAHSRGALCLDGSPPAYYYRQSVELAVRNWIIHLQSGAWCATKQECFDRSSTHLGSSKFAPALQPLKGIMSSNCESNPDFCLWHMVDFLYCDGGSFLGNKSEPVLSEWNTPEYLRGALVFDALVDYLKTYTLFKNAEQVVFTGSSAGGLGALIHADHLRERLPDSVTTMHVVVDGSLFVDACDGKNFCTMDKMLHDVFSFHQINDSSSIKQCTRTMKTENQWKCFLPDVFQEFVFSPIFFINSLYDSWYRQNALHIPCSLAVCPNDGLSKVDLAIDKLLQAREKILRSKKNGVFLTSCPVHTILMSEKFTLVTSGMCSVQQALGAWLNHQGNSRNLTELLTTEEALKKCQVYV